MVSRSPGRGGGSAHHTATAATARVEAGVTRTPAALKLTLKDSGCGIPADQLSRVFIPFYTTKQKGTGLGLAISHRIINQHGGTIEVRSTIGQGSTFSVFLPAAEPVPAGKVEDITETGRMTALGKVEAVETTSPPDTAPERVTS